MAIRARSRAPVTTSPIPTRFSDAEVARIDRALTLRGLRSRSAFIREAVLERVHSLETSKVVEIRDVSEKEAIRLISRYLAKRPGVHYTSDMADELGIDLPVAFAAAQTLVDRGRARVGED